MKRQLSDVAKSPKNSPEIGMYVPRGQIHKRGLDARAVETLEPSCRIVMLARTFEVPPVGEATNAAASAGAVLLWKTVLAM